MASSKHGITQRNSLVHPFPCIDPTGQTTFLDLSGDTNTHIATIGAGTTIAAILVGALGCYGAWTTDGTDPNPWGTGKSWYPANSIIHFAVKPGWKFGCKQNTGATFVTVIEGA